MHTCILMCVRTCACCPLCQPAANPSSSYINSTTPEFDRTTIRFAQVDERRMWAHVFCLLLLSAYSVYLFVRFQKQTILEEAQFKSSHRSLVARHSILLEGLPRVSTLPPLPSPTLHFVCFRLPTSYFVHPREGISLCSPFCFLHGVRVCLGSLDHSDSTEPRVWGCSSQKQVGVVDAELKCEARRVFGDHFVHLEVSLCVFSVSRCASKRENMLGSVFVVFV